MTLICPRISDIAESLDLTFQFSNLVLLPIPVAARSKPCGCGCWLAGIADSNPAERMDVCLFKSYLLSGISLCIGLISRPERLYRVWCV